MSFTRILLTVFIGVIYTTIALAQPVVSVEIKGVQGELADNIRLLLSIEQQKNNSLLSEGRIHRLHEKAGHEISIALQPFGYYQPTINSQLIQIKPHQWQATYEIQPGPALRIGEMDIQLFGAALNDPVFMNTLRNLPLLQDHIFRHQDYEEAKSLLAKIAAERGYFDGRFTLHRIDVDLQSYKSHIHLHYDSGPRYQFGIVNLYQDVLDPELLQRFLTFQSGDDYLLDHLLELQQALNDSDYFYSVEVWPQIKQASDHAIPIDVTLTPRKRHKYLFGLGYGTDTGARSRLGWEIPRLNRNGHRFNSEIKLSEIGNAVSLRYLIPVFNPRTDQLIYSAGLTNEKTDTSDSTVTTVGVTLNHTRQAWREALSLNYQNEHYRVGITDDRTHLLIPGINWQRIWGKARIYTLDGLRLDFGIRGASNLLLSDTSFVQGHVNLKAIEPLTDHDRFIGRINLGRTWIDNFDELPASLRFFTGGANSVRGYAYQSLGPVDTNGNIIGGQYLIAGSLEYEHRFTDQWGMALFIDSGNAINKLTDTLERGAGAGLRWQSPIGPLRFDVASAITRPDKPWRLHITLGPDL